MIALTVLAILIACVYVLHAVSVNIRDGEALHDLTVQVHTLRNEYLASLRGDIMEVGESRKPAAKTDAIAAAAAPADDAAAEAVDDAPELAQAA